MYPKMKPSTFTLPNEITLLMYIVAKIYFSFFLKSTIGVHMILLNIFGAFLVVVHIARLHALL